jgi:hypothetical protein
LVTVRWPGTFLEDPVRLLEGKSVDDTLKVRKHPKLAKPAARLAVANTSAAAASATSGSPKRLVRAATTRADSSWWPG